MKNTSKLFFVFAAVAGLILMASAYSLPSAHAAGPWYVSNSGNDSNDCASTTTTCASINGALNKPGFVTGDTIYVAIGTYTGSGTEVVLLNKNATLSGGWNASFATQSGMSTIDGQSARRGVRVDISTTAALNRIEVQNGNFNDGGGGIYNGGTLTLTNSIVSSNSVSGYYGDSGGGIYNAGTLTINNSTVSNNSISGSGSGSSGGGGIHNVSMLTINNSVIINNSAGVYKGVAFLTRARCC